MKHFIKHVRPSEDSPVLLLLDNHSSHLSVDVLEMAKSSGIIMLSFPPHCSHRLQPLDRSVFGPFKRSYYTQMDAWMRSHPGQTATIYDIPGIVAEALTTASTPRNIQGGFRAAGISPLNPEIFTDADYAPSYVTDRPAGPSQDVNEAGPSQDVNEAGPPQDVNEAGPSQDVNEAGPSQDVNEAGPSQDVNEAGPPQDVNEAGPSQDVNEAGPSHDVNEAGPPQDVNEAGPPQDVNEAGLSPEIIRPLPKAKARKQASARSRKRKSAVLTDTPEKRALEEEQKRRKKTKKTDSKTEKQTKKKQQAKKKRTAKKKLKYSSESDDSDDVFCLVCVESYGNSRPREKWIRCQECQRWAHRGLHCCRGKRSLCL